MRFNRFVSVITVLVLIGTIATAALQAGATKIDRTTSGATGADIVFPTGGGSGSVDLQVPYNVYLREALLTLEGKPSPFYGSLSWDEKAGIINGAMSNVSYMYGSLVLDKLFKNWTSPEGWSGADLQNLTIEEKRAILMKLAGIYFGPNVQLPMNGMGNGDPCDIAIDKNGNIHVIFASTKQTPQMNYFRSTDGGQTWKEIKVFQANGFAYPHIYIGPNGYIHILYNNIMMGGGPLIYQRSKDNGTTFESMQLIFRPQDVRVAFGADGVMHFVGFMAQSYPPFENRVYYWNSTDNGTTQNPEIQVSDDPGNTAYKEGTNIAIDSTGKIHIIWLDYRNSVNGDDGEIYYTSSVDHAHFRINMPVEAMSMVYHGLPEMVVDADDTLHIVWADNRTGDMDVYYTNSTDSGKTYSPSMAINTVTDGEQSYPSIALGPNGEIHVVWVDGLDTTGGDIAYSISTDHGVTFTDQVIVNDQVMPSQQLPRVAVDAGNIPNVIWWDDRNAMEVFFSKLYTPYFKEGELEGIADLGAEPAGLVHIMLTANITAETDVLLSIRTSHDNKTWSAWENCTLDFSTIQSPAGRYVNWRIALVSNDGLSTPSVTSMNLETSKFMAEGSWTGVAKTTVHDVTEATVTWNATEGDLLTMLVSNDDGATWKTASMGTKVTFPQGGNEIRVKALLSSPGNRTPGLSKIKVDYTSVIYPTDLRLVLGNNGALIWNMTGELGTKVQVNFTKVLAEFLKGYKGGLDLVPFTLDLSSKTAGVVNVSNISILIDLPPVIESWTPVNDTAHMDEGTTMTFKVVAKDPDGKDLTYKWFLNGTEVQGTTGPEYVHPASFDDMGTYQVKVSVSDGRFVVNRTWTLVVANVDRPPIIDSADPVIWTVEYIKGTAATFKVVAHDPDGDALTYSWFVDGTTVPGASGASWVMNYNIMTLGKAHTLKVVVSAGPFSVEAAWNVTVKSGAAPKLDDWTPKGKVNLTAGEKIALNISASHPDGLALNYTWSINGLKVLGANSKSYLYQPTTAGTYTVKVTVSDGNRTADHEWSVVVKKKGSKGSSDTLLVWVALAIVLAVVGGATAFLSLRRRENGGGKGN